jgi:hypothetical protein
VDTWYTMRHFLVTRVRHTWCEETGRHGSEREREKRKT